MWTGSVPELCQLIGSKGFHAELKVKMLAALMSVCQYSADPDLHPGSKAKTNKEFANILKSILDKEDRRKEVGNLISKLYLERAAETPLALLDSDSLITNKGFLELFFKSFSNHILDESSFEALKPLAMLLARKENTAYFIQNHGLEFLYSLVTTNPVFLDDSQPSKSLMLVFDCLLLHGKPDDLKTLFGLFFTSYEIQNDLDLYANFLSDLISLTMVYVKLELNSDLMPTLLKDKLFYVGVCVNHAVNPVRDPRGKGQAE